MTRLRHDMQRAEVVQRGLVADETRGGAPQAHCEAQRGGEHAVDARGAAVSSAVSTCEREAELVQIPYSNFFFEKKSDFFSY